MHPLYYPPSEGATRSTRGCNCTQCTRLTTGLRFVLRYAKPTIVVNYPHLVIGFLEALLCALAAGPDRLGAVADKRSGRVHVVQLSAVLVDAAKQHRHAEWPGLPGVTRGQQGSQGVTKHE